MLPGKPKIHEDGRDINIGLCEEPGGASSAKALKRASYPLRPAH
jgi:hypothetical protein